MFHDGFAKPVRSEKIRNELMSSHA